MSPNRVSLVALPLLSDNAYLARSDTRFYSFLADTALRALPSVLLIVVAARLAWFERGTFASRDWLGYAFLGGLLLVTVLAVGRVYVPVRKALLGIASLLAFTLWCAVALAWSPLPTLGREEVLLVAFYCVVLAFPLLLIRDELSRWLVLGAVVVAVGVVCVAAALELRSDPTESMFRFGRLIFPVSYVNGNAAFFLIGLWPAVALASLRAAPLVVRAVAVGAAGGCARGVPGDAEQGGRCRVGGVCCRPVCGCPLAARLLVPLVLAAAAAGVRTRR